MGKGSKKEKIIHLRKNGFSIDEISKQIGCSKSTVSYHVNNENLGGTLGWLKKVKEDVFLKKSINCR
jgi:orotate phosphoribosyltransferase-like protein